MSENLSMLISVIVATYNWPEALAAVLRALADQNDTNFEVIVGDDGSDRATTDVIKAGPQPVKHVWHEDRGFRLAEIRNRAILASRGEYCIFLDGDCIPRPSFVRAHRRLAEPGYFVTGNRMALRKAITKRILSEGLSPHDWGLSTWLWLRASRQINRIPPMVTLPLGPLRNRIQQNWSAIGCNFAAWRSDLDHIDGFDASFIGWGGEDNDIFLRLLHAGVRRKTGRFATGVIHLWHESAKSGDNGPKFESTLERRRVCALQGMSSLSAEIAPPGIDGRVPTRVQT